MNTAAVSERAEVGEGAVAALDAITGATDGAIDGAIESAKPEDQRRWERHEHRRTVQIHPLEAGAPGKAVPTRVVDFSTMGVGLIHSRKMAKGQQFVLPLGTAGGGAVPLLYTVVHCRGPKNGLYAVGAQLVSVMDLKQFSEAVPEGFSVSQYIRSLL